MSPRFHKNKKYLLLINQGGIAKMHNPVQSRKGLNITEIILLGSALILTLIGLIAYYIDVDWFKNTYLKEDSFIEDITLVPLLVAVIICIRYLRKLSRYRSWLFSACLIAAICFSIFITGEEISWGQRIFGFQSSGYFEHNNAQKETNLHNLVVDGKKVNKIVFSVFLSVSIALYLIILPFLYSRNKKVRDLTDWAGIPIPHENEIVATIVMFLITELIRHPKNAELREMEITTIFLLILLYPKNIHVFRKTDRDLP